MKRIDVVGFGPGDYEYMTMEAIHAIEAADLVVGYTTYVDLLKAIFPEKAYLATPMMGEVKRCQMALDEARKGKRIALVSSGDAGIYGMAGIMLEIAGKCEEKIDVHVVAGVTAASAGAALIGAPLMNDFAVVSMSDLMVPFEQIMKRVEAAAAGDFVICIYNPKSKKRVDHLAKAAEIIMRYRSEETPVGLVRHIGRKDKNYEIVTLGTLAESDVDMFTTVIVGNSMTQLVDGKMITARGYQVSGEK